MADLINVGSAANDGTGDTLREAFTKLNTAYADSPKISKSTGTIDIKPDNSGGFPTAILSTFTGSATHNILDGNEHKVNFILESGGDWTTATDNRMWYLKEPAELGNIIGASGNISPTTMKQWIANGNIVTMKYDQANTKFIVTKVSGDSPITHSEPILADGSVQMDNTFTPSDDYDVITKKYLETAATAASPFQFDYKWQDNTVTGTLASGKVGVNNDDPAQATKLYISKHDRIGRDMSLMLKNIGAGDWVNIHAHDDTTKSYAFDVTSDPVIETDQVVFDVTYYTSSADGTLPANDRVDIYWRMNVPIVADPVTSTTAGTEERVATIVSITQADYDALGTGRPADKLYIIKG